jgi:hypothetical protein
MTRAVSGLAVYTFATGRYDLLGPSDNTWFRNVRWLRDGRRLLVRDTQGIRLLDTATQRSRLLVPVTGYMIGKSVGISRDDRFITYTETAAEGDIWLAAFESPTS